jgi:DDE superfamily endonuclease
VGFCTHQENQVSISEEKVRPDMLPITLEEHDTTIFTHLFDDESLYTILQSRRKRYCISRIPRIKSTDWKESIANNLDATCFKKTFRMKRESFENLYTKIKDNDIFTRPSRGAKQASVKVQIQAVLYYLGSKNTVFEVSQKFGIGEGTFYSYWNRVQKAIRQDIKADVIQWPSAGKKAVIKADIYEKSRLTDCVGFIDATQVPLLQAPIKDCETYWNRKKRYSINVQATCDHLGIFTSYVIGWPGSVHDSKIFWSSDISVHHRQLFANHEYLLADAGYAITSYCITPFRGLPARQQQTFNSRVSKVRRIIEQAFGRLKNRWPMLKELRANNKRMICAVIEICFILHNFLELCADNWEEELGQESSEDMENRNEEHILVDNVFMRQQKILGETKRSLLMAYLL